MQTENPTLFLKNTSLYVFFSSVQGVLEIMNIDDLKNYSFKVEKNYRYQANISGGTAMRQKIIVLVIVSFLIFQPLLISAGSIPMPTGRTCDGSQMPDGTFIPAGQVREITYGGVRYRCVGCGGCTPISSGSSSNSSSYTPYVPPASTSQQMAIGLMGAFLSGFFSTLMSGMFDDNSAYDAQKQREYEEQQRRLAEEKKRQEEQKKTTTFQV